MRKKMTEKTKAKIKKFAGELIDDWCERSERTTTYDADRTASDKFAIDNWPVLDDPDAELMRECEVLLGDIYERRTRRYYLMYLPDTRRWLITRRTPSHDGYINAFNGSYTLEHLRDKIQSMVPPPRSKFEEAAEAARLQDEWARDQLSVREGGEFDTRLKLIAAFFEAKRREKGGG